LIDETECIIDIDCRSNDFNIGKKNANDLLKVSRVLGSSSTIKNEMLFSMVNFNL
jgi:hypothetical protein